MLTETKERRAPLDTAAAATYTNVLPNYLEKLRCNGSGPVFIKRNGLVRYDPNDLDAWLEAGKKRATSNDGDAQYALVSGEAVNKLDFLIRARSPLAVKIAAQTPQIAQALPAKSIQGLRILILADPALAQISNGMTNADQQKRSTVSGDDAY
jgi:hypothetical protein